MRMAAEVLYFFSKVSPRMIEFPKIDQMVFELVLFEAGVELELPDPLLLLLLLLLLFPCP